MSPRKLTEDDKHEILELYRNSAATTSTLAVNYGVSSSTISRFLKNKLSQAEYEDLIQQKRLARTPRGEKSSNGNQTKKKGKAKNKSNKSASKPTPQEPEIIITQDTPAVEEKKSEPAEETTTPSRRRRRRSSAPEVATKDKVAEVVAVVEEETNEEPKTKTKPIINKSSDRPVLKKEEIEPDEELDLIALEEMLGEEIDEDEDDDDDDDWELENDTDITYPHAEARNFDVEILPLSAASFPRTCYLVTDRTAELIVKPLEDFADLGSIPKAEMQQQTLPVFDNHRVAKRFSHRRERVIKVPDGTMLYKTSKYLHAKGITRLLLDGQIYSLDIS